jgi:hypothetical protein
LKKFLGHVVFGNKTSPLPTFSGKNFSFPENFFESAPEWEGARIFYGPPPNQIPLGTAYKPILFGKEITRKT